MRLTKSNYCAASMRNMAEWLNTVRDDAGHCDCPLCGKLLLLRKNARGWRTIFPTHTPGRAAIATSAATGSAT